MPLLDVFFTMMWFFLWILWFFLLFRVILDIFRSRDLGGWGKADWLVFAIVLPFLGVLVYLIARGAPTPPALFSPDRRRKPQAAHDGCQEPGRSAPEISGHGPDTTEPKVSCQEGPGMVPFVPGLMIRLWARWWVLRRAA